MRIKRAEGLIGIRDFEGAKRLLRGVLLREKGNTDALYLLAIAEAELKNFESALAILTRIISIQPLHGAAHYTKANLLLMIDRHCEALPHHDQAVKLLPTNPWVLVNRGVSRASLMRFEEAINDFEMAICLDPKISAAYGNKANALLEIEQLEESLAFFNKAIELDSLNTDALSGKSGVLIRLKRAGESLTYSNLATKLKPDCVKAWNNRGVALNDLKLYQEALVCYERAIELKADYAEAWTNRGVALNNLGRHEEALASHQLAIEFKPEYAAAWNNRGVSLRDLNRQEEALDSNQRALQLKPDHADAWNNRGVALRDLKRYDEAFACYERAIELNSECADAIYNKGFLQLAHKDFLNGFQNYRRRWETKEFSSQPLETKLPRCVPTTNGGTLLLWAEQGVGDEIFYAGMLTQALERFPEIELEADTRLHPTLRRSFPMVSILGRSQPSAPGSVTRAELQAPIGDLGHILELDVEAIASTRRPFLVADEEKACQFALRAPFSSGKVVCGLAWRSQNKSFGDEKSICLEQLEPILKNTQLEFINLQYGEVDAEIQSIRDRLGVHIHQIKGVNLYNDIDGLLALISACDMVITVSNVTAHLAGSIGKRGCVFVPFSKGKIWYWHLDDAYSFWYPSLKLFYQKSRHDWTNDILQAKTWIEQGPSWNQ